MAFTLTNLPWLPEAEPAFSARVKGLLADDTGLGQALSTLATARLSSTQAFSFARAMRKLRAAGADFAPLTPFRLTILSSFTAEMVVDALPAACARHGVAVDVRLGDFGQIMQALGDAHNAAFAHDPQAVLLLFDHRWLGLDRFAATGDDGVAEALGLVENCLTLASERGLQALVPSLATPVEPLFGSFEGQVAKSVTARIARFNDGLAALVQAQGATLFDVAALAAQVGTANWFDPVAWNMHKAPFWSGVTPLYADAIARLIGAMAGRARKCLVLDCDNTLWGGVIGDDGLAGIRIGQGSGEGESFAAIQHYALALKTRGIILAISSKNDDATARAAFRDHPDMVLRESDIAVFQANWQDKPANLEAIAKTLNIGLDSLVFLDDNAAERAQMRAALPMVAVPELPGDPAEYVLHLAHAGYFEALTFGAEDAARAQSYGANAQRAAVQAQARDLGDYLSRLEMVIDLRPFDAIQQPRIVQLINKTNQFNLMTNRLTDAAVAAIMADPAVVAMQVRLADRFSDFGLIGIIIARAEGDTLGVTDWLMSCRVLGRKVEEAMLAALVAAARERGLARITTHYRPTPKNAMVADLFDRLGLERMADREDGGRDYTLNVAAFVDPDLPHQPGK